MTRGDIGRYLSRMNPSKRLVRRRFIDLLRVCSSAC
jgi:hypothetical protein